MRPFPLVVASILAGSACSPTTAEVHGRVELVLESEEVVDAGQVTKGPIGFEIELPHGPHEVLFRMNALPGSDPAEYCALQQIHVGETSDAFQIELKRSVSLSGRFVHEGNSPPAQGTSVPVYLAGWRSPLYYAESDARGEFVLRGIPQECALLFGSNPEPLQVGSTPVDDLVISIEVSAFNQGPATQAVSELMPALAPFEV